MTKKTMANSAMRKIMESRIPYISFLLRKKDISNVITSFFDQVSLFRSGEQKCFSNDNIFESDLTVNNLSIAEWEWDTNEIHLDKTLIKRQFKESILLSIDVIEKALQERFPGNSFVVSFSIQFGKFRNINIRVCQDLGIAILDEDLDKYNQPVMQVYLST
jgi:hypothetical protein